ncbi:MAG: helix-turn-helix transcriptional regulator [Deltaproteobacteria bacterium]|nr:helix-turn-helix transcriptional regulator [Deltaproteobacteria bacterium]
MARTLDEVIHALPTAQRAGVEARTQELIQEVEGLRALRQLLGLTQEELGDRLGIKQPSVHKIERQADVQLSTLRRFVEAAGGSLGPRSTFPTPGQFGWGVGAPAAPPAGGGRPPPPATPARGRAWEAPDTEAEPAEPQNVRG